MAETITEKPGWKTSELWLNFAAMILGTLVASGIFADGHIVLRVAGIALSALSALGYTNSRAVIKRSAAMERAALGKPLAPEPEPAEA